MIRFFARSRRNLGREGLIWLTAFIVSLPSFLLILQTQQVQAVVQGDGIAIYGEGTVTTPRYREWIQATTSFNAESTGATAAATLRHVSLKASPTRNEMMAGVQTTGGELYIQRWDGSAWTAEWNVTVGDGNLARFDLSYERSSGDTMVVYSKNVATTNELAYRVWNGTSWTTETTYDAVRTSGIVDGVALISRGSGSDHMAMAWGDRNFDLSANYWDGTSWQTEPAAVLEVSLSKVGTATTLTNWSFDLEFEDTSGELLVVWGIDATVDPRYVTRGAGAAGAWSAVATATPLFEEPTDLDLAGEPGSNYIAYINSTDNGADSDAAIWDGAAWGNASNFDISNDTVGAGTSNNAIAWVLSGVQSRAVGTYDDANAAGLDWITFNKNTPAWTVQTDCTTACSSQPASGDDNSHRLRKNPFDDAQLIWIGSDINSDLFAKRLVFDGTNFTWSNADGGIALEATLSSITGISSDFAFNKYIPPAFNQSAYRLFANVNSTDVGSALAAQDTSYTLTSNGELFRLRSLVHVTGSTVGVSGQSFKLQFATKSGTCDTGFVGETYADVTTTTDISYNNNATPTDGSALTANASDPTHASDTIRNQTYEEANNFTNSQAAIAVGEDGKWDFALFDNTAPDSTSYCFRIVTSTGTVLDTYTVVPEVTTSSPPGPTTDQVLRHGNWWSGGAEQSFFWAQ